MSQSSENSNRCLIVLGMHRSGTSAVAGVLSMLGADAGPSLMPAREDNPKGFWEHADIVAVHEKLLAHLESDWNDVRRLPDGWWRRADVSPYRNELRSIVRRDFSRSALWMLKDPRIGRLLPLWLEILRDAGVRPHFVICLREPAEVARSLERRDGMLAAEAQLLWLEHLLDAERLSRGYPRVTLAYDQLLADWKAAALQVAQVLSLPIRVDDPNAIARIEGFLEPSLRHHVNSGRDEDDHPIAGLAREAYRLAKSVPLDRLGGALAPVDERVGQMVALVAPWAVRLRSLENKLPDLEERNASLEEVAAVIGSSTSWRITAPLRALSRALSGVKSALFGSRRAGAGRRSN